MMKKQLNIFEEDDDESAKLAKRVADLSYKLKFRTDGHFNKETISPGSKNVYPLDDKAKTEHDPDECEQEEPALGIQEC